MAVVTLSPGVSFANKVDMSNSKSVVHFLLVDFGKWVTILGMMVTILGMVADHPWKLSPGLNLVD